MGQANGQTTQDKQMQRGDQRQRIDMQCTAQPSLSSLKGWWWNGCLFFDDWKHHKLLALYERTSLAKSQLTLLCQISTIEELFSS